MECRQQAILSCLLLPPLDFFSGDSSSSVLTPMSFLDCVKNILPHFNLKSTLTPARVSVLQCKQNFLLLLNENSPLSGWGLPGACYCWVGRSQRAEVKSALPWQWFTGPAVVLSSYSLQSWLPLWGSPESPWISWGSGPWCRHTIEWLWPPLTSTASVTMETPTSLTSGVLTSTSLPTGQDPIWKT